MNEHSIERTDSRIRWQGHDIPQDEMPAYLIGVAATIQSVWAEEYQLSQSEPLTGESYRRIADKVSRFSLNVTRAALNWINEENAVQAEVGRTIAIHSVLHAIIAGADRAQQQYPMLKSQELIENGIQVAAGLVEKAARGEFDAAQLAMRTNSTVFTVGESQASKEIGLPVTWVTQGLHVQIPKFREEFLEKEGRNPTPTELVDHFKIGRDANAQRAARKIVRNFLYPREETDREEIEDIIGDIVLSQVLPSVDQSSHQLLKQEVAEVLAGLTQRELTVLELRFGLVDGRSRTLNEVGQGFHVTRERIRQIEASGLKKIRSRPRKSLQDYLTEPLPKEN